MAAVMGDADSMPELYSVQVAMPEKGGAAVRQEDAQPASKIFYDKRRRATAASLDQRIAFEPKLSARFEGSGWPSGKGSARLASKPIVALSAPKHRFPHGAICIGRTK